MGPSGSGKSTLLHCMAGLDTPTAGTVFVGDVDLTTLAEKQLTLLRRDKVGFVFQAYNLMPTLTAGGEHHASDRHRRATPDAAWFDSVVDTIGIRDRLSHRPSELSGGQQQRVAGARALVSKPEIVFADEPTGNLDSRAGHELLGFLRGAVDDHGQTIVMVTHDAQRGGLRGPDRVPRGRAHRGRDARADGRAGAGSPEVAGVLTPCSARTSEPAGAQAAAAPHGLAIVLGVSFMSGTYVFTDTMTSAFDELSRRATPTSTSSCARRTRSRRQTSALEERDPMPESVLETVGGRPRGRAGGGGRPRVTRRSSTRTPAR